MNIAELRKHRLDIESFPFYNDKNIGIALFDVTTAFLGAFLLDKFFNFSNTLSFCKNKQFVYYLLVIPFGILVHHLIAHFNSFQKGEFFVFPNEITYLNKKLFSLTLNVYHFLLIILIIYIFNICNS